MSKQRSPVQLEYPSISPIESDGQRPLWSVMIPTYNNTNYLAQTLRSVLEQAPPPEQMQIEVIDNHSTQDDPELMVRSLGQGRISFYRQPQNVGMVGNFNTCIRRSQGEVVHILHNDDYVAPSFYEAFTATIRTHSEVDLFGCRSLWVDEQSEVNTITPRLEALETYPCKDTAEFFGHTSILLPPAVVIRRRFYENFGGYTPSLKCVNDTEMYMRAVLNSNALMINQPLAYYRKYSTNTSSSDSQQGEVIRELLLLSDVLTSQYKQFDHTRFKEHLKSVAFGHTYGFLSNKNYEAAKNNFHFWWNLLTPTQKVQQLFASILRGDRLRLKMILESI